MIECENISVWSLMLVRTMATHEIIKEFLLHDNFVSKLNSIKIKKCEFFGVWTINHYSLNNVIGSEN